MPIQIKKNPRETSQNLVRRFSRRIQQSGVLRRARNIRDFRDAFSRAGFCVARETLDLPKEAKASN
jgi:hypothetical protein